MENKNGGKKKHGGPMSGMAPVEKAKDFKKSLKRLIKYIGNYNKLIIIVALILISSSALSVVSPKILGKATTELGNNIMQRAIYEKIQEVLNNVPAEMKNNLDKDTTVKDLIDMGWISESEASNIPDTAKEVFIFKKPEFNYSYILKILIITLGLYLVSGIFMYISNKIMAYISQKVTYKLRLDVDEKLDRLPLKFFDSHTHGEILSRITNDIDNISTMLQQTLTQILDSIFTLIGILVMMISINIVMAGIVVLVIPVSLIFIGIIVKSSQKYFIAQQEILGELNSQIEETYSADLVVKTFNMQNSKIEKFKKINDRLCKASWKAQFLSGIMMPIINVVNNLAYVGICVIGAKFTIEGKMSIGDIQAFIQYVKQFTEPLIQVANMLSTIQSTVASAERVFEILDEEEEKKEAESPKKLDLVRGEVKCENICFSYNKKEELIKDWSLDVRPGQTVAIVGPTGAGKTTIVNLLMRFYDIDSGDIKIDGVSIYDMSRKDLRGMFAMVLQDTWLFKGTIKENLRYAREDALDEELYQAAYLAHADHFIRSLPKGYDFELNDDASNISSGQRQLLTIARAILADCPILILDEATSNVDTRTEELIQKAMNKLMEGRTSFVIAHRLSTIKSADIILVMEHGRIVERGNHEELLKLNGKYAILYNSQFAEEE